MTFAPDTISDLGLYLVDHGVTTLGIVGNLKHCAGYHLGRDRIYGPCACRSGGTLTGECIPGKGDGDYSVVRDRDRAGLSNAASALDIGRVNGTLTGLRLLSKWFVEQCQAGLCPDVREVIFTPDGKTVWRWESSDNTLRTGPGQGDNSHLTHTHVSFYRDSEFREKVSLFRPYFEPGEEMFLAFEQLYDLPAGTVLYQSAVAGGPKVGTLASPTTVLSLGTPFIGGKIADEWRIVHWMTGVPDGNYKDKGVYVRAVDCTNGRPPDPTVPKADLDAALARITKIKTDVAAA